MNSSSQIPRVNIIFFIGPLYNTIAIKKKNQKKRCFASKRIHIKMYVIVFHLFFFFYPRIARDILQSLQTRYILIWALSLGDRYAVLYHLEIHYAVTWTHVLFMMNYIGLSYIVYFNLNIS